LLPHLFYDELKHTEIIIGVNTMKPKYRSHWHCVFNLQYHLVLVTRYRRKCLTKELLQRVHEIAKNVCEMSDVELLQFGGESDHAHMIISMHPNVMPSKLVNSIKTVTSRLLRKEFPNHLKKFFSKPTLWTRAYCLLSAGGAPIETLKRYVEKQGGDSQ